MIVSPSCVRPTSTGCTWATLSLTVNTKLPLWLIWIASFGTTTRSCEVRRVTSRLQSWPGHNSSSAFSKVARATMVPVVASTELSRMASLPLALALEPCGMASTSAPAFIASRRAGAGSG